MGIFPIYEEVPWREREAQGIPEGILDQCKMFWVSMDSSCCYKIDTLEVVVDNREMAVDRVNEWWDALLRVDSVSWIENDWDRNGY